MRAIVGLGNPGERYQSTRHNVGFWVIDALSRSWSIPVHRRRFSALCGEGQFAGERVILLKPQVYMNRSGASVKAVQQFYQLPLDQLLVIIDDLALKPGTMRMRARGRAGGHNGLKDIIFHLGSQDFPRLRIGIGPAPQGLDAACYVLAPLPPEEEDILAKAADSCVLAIESWIKEGLEKTMSRYNRSVDRIE